jgi:hypothetical protein
MLDIINHFANPSMTGLASLQPDFFIRLLINAACAALLIRGVHYSAYGKKDFFFTSFMFSTAVFLITYFLGRVELSTGAAFGMFAVFSLLRYRTEDISAKDMTYLFLCIALGLVNAVARISYLESSLIDLVIVSMAWVLDGGSLLRNEMMQTVIYEKIDNIKPGNHDKLMEDLNMRTGLTIHRISIGDIDFMRDTAVIKIYYYRKANRAQES